MQMKKRGLFIMSLGFMIIALSPVGQQMRTNFPLMFVGIAVVLIGVYEYYVDKKEYNARKKDQDKKEHQS